MTKAISSWSSVTTPYQNDPSSLGSLLSLPISTDATWAGSGTRVSYPVRSKPTTRNRAINTATTATAPFQRRNTRKVLSSSIRATK